MDATESHPVAAAQGPAWQTNRWSLRRRVIVSALVSWHLAAVCAAPLVIPPTSVLWVRLWAVFRPYAEGLYLDHGYRFFAPEPGPSHLLVADLHSTGGGHRRIVLPDRTRDRPRLYYHRHFMLAEHLNLLIETAASPRLPEALLRSYAEHLLSAEGADEVTITLRRHFIPRPADVLAGRRPDDPELFRDRPLGTFARTPTGIRRIDAARQRDDSPTPRQDPPLTRGVPPAGPRNPRTAGPGRPAAVSIAVPPIDRKPGHADVTARRTPEPAADATGHNSSFAPKRR